MIELPKPFGRFNVNGPDGHRIKGYTEQQVRELLKTVQDQRDALYFAMQIIEKGHPDPQKFAELFLISGITEK